MMEIRYTAKIARVMTAIQIIIEVLAKCFFLRERAAANDTAPEPSMLITITALKARDMYWVALRMMLRFAGLSYMLRPIKW